MEGYIITFVGGGCDGEYLKDNDSVTRSRLEAKVFPTVEAANLSNYQLLGLNRSQYRVEPK